MSARITKRSKNDLMVAYLQTHIGEWIAHATLRQLTEMDDVPRALRALRQQGYPIEFDGKGNSRLLPSYMNPARGDGRQISAAQRVRILERDNSRCQLCGVGVNEPAADGQPARLEIDHIKPRDEDGPTEDWNLRTLCHVCNHDRNEGSRRRHPISTDWPWTQGPLF